MKAVTTDGENKIEVMYDPTEISTLWSQISKFSIGVFLLFSCILSVILTVVIVISTKMARRGYRPISEED